MTTDILILITFPLIGVIFAWLYMQRAIYQAETPTKKKQLMLLRLIAGGSLLWGLLEALFLFYNQGNVPPVPALLCIGAVGFASAVTAGFFAGKQIACGFMNHPERFRKALLQQVLIGIAPMLGLAVFFLLLFA